MKTPPIITTTTTTMFGRPQNTHTHTHFCEALIHHITIRQNVCLMHTSNILIDIVNKSAESWFLWTHPEVESNKFHHSTDDTICYSAASLNWTLIFNRLEWNNFSVVQFGDRKKKMLKLLHPKMIKIYKFACGKY